MNKEQLMRTGVVAIAIWICLFGCGSSGSGGGAGGAASGGASSGGASSGGASTGGAPTGGGGGLSGGGGSPAACTGCAAGEGCLRPTVTRSADTSLQPWVVWPNEADGKGSLIVNALDGTTSLSRVTQPNADMTPATASYLLDLGCLPAKTLVVTAFLDDNENATPTATFSGDYRDSCMLDRKPEITVTAGAITPMDLVLNNSCD